MRIQLLLAFVAALSYCLQAQALPAGITPVCTISFEKDVRRPARVEDSALPCMTRARQALAADTSAKLYLVGTADRVRDNQPGHGHARIEQDMSGEDLRYADVAAYRALNTKAYLVRWMQADAKRIVPLTIYDDGQSVEVYLVSDRVSFRAIYGKQTAPILSRPCTVAPCAAGVEEFLLAQQRERIAR